jgi:hypothetical protein
MELVSRFGVVDGRAHPRTEPGRSYQVPGRTKPAASRWYSGYPVPMPGLARIGIFVLAAVLLTAACGGAPAPSSFDPSGACSTDGRAAGAYPDLEALVPKRYQGVPPGTLDSGRNCTAANLGVLASLGITEVRFAGATWSFGAERAAVLAVFRTHGLSGEALADFYAASARAAARTKIVATSAPMIAGRPGRRLDTMTGERVQTVVVWPSAEPDVVNVVITNDLPDARIKDAVDAFGGS